jgi:hypothetical protein
MKFRVGFLGIVMFISASVAAQSKLGGFQNGTTLLANCAHAARIDVDPAADLPSEDGFCVGYIFGVDDATGRDHCRPEGTTLIQNVRVVVKYLNDHPEKLHEKASTLILQAFRDAFPCKQKDR